MSKLVVISFGSGNLLDGFPRVTTQLWTPGFSFPEQFVGSLPPAPDLVELHQLWQSTYRCLCDRSQFRSPTKNPLTAQDDSLEIAQSGITNISQTSFAEVSQRFYEQFNHWLLSSGFVRIERQLRSYLTPHENIRITLEAHDELLCRLPWHLWELIQDYRNTEVSFSQSEYKRRQSLPQSSPKSRVRILAILGNSQGIDLQADAQFLQSLTDAEVTFLVQPSRQEFNAALWERTGWDILFFAGHSQTRGQAGHLYINENADNNSITIEQLEEALKAAIDRSLKLAIFNSCDGLGLALALEKLHIPVVVAMREPVPNRVAQEFFKGFLEAFAIDHIPFYQAVRQSRSQLQGLEHEFPGASWLPIIYQNPAVEPPSWLQLGGIPPCPYRGLLAFQETDSHLFFGREEFTNQLVTAVRYKPLIAIVGASGSGKSSVVFAGLIPHLRREGLGSREPYIISFRPGNNPFDNLAEAIASLSQELPIQNSTILQQQTLEFSTQLQQDDRTLCAKIEALVQKPPQRRLILVIDQFEELYTLCPESDRPVFLDGLLYAVNTAPSFTLIITLRADFYGYVLSYRPFSDALQGAVYNLGPMSYEELQKAIEQPAAQMWVRLEQGLTDKLIQATSGSAGNLPLLEFALSQLWSKQQEGWLTHQAYEAIGGVEEALANHADMVYLRLNESDRQRMQQIFIQLVQPGAGTEASRRIANREEIGEENWQLVTLHLASTRLVVTNRDTLTGDETVEVAHEALIRNWERLKHWIQVDSEFRRWQEDLRITRRRWEGSDREEDALLRGRLLSDAQYWYSQRQDELSLSDRQFIQLSLATQEREIKQRKRRRQTLIASLIIGLLAALMLAGIAWWGWQNARIKEIQAISTSTTALLASNQSFGALNTGIKAGRKIRTTSGVDKNTQTEVIETLLQTISFVREQNRLEAHREIVESGSINPNGQLLATASRDNTVKLWNLEGKLQRSFTAHAEGGISSVAFNPEGTLIATAGWDNTAKLWDLNGKQLQVLKGHQDKVHQVSFSPDGVFIATVSWDNTAKLWNLDGKEVLTLKGHRDKVNSLAFNPDGTLMVTASSDKTAKLWNLDGKEVLTLTGHPNSINSVSFSPDGKIIATASGDKTIRLWSLEGKELQILRGHENGVNSVSFSPGGKIIATASGDKTVKLWSRNGKELETLYGHDDAVNNVSFSPDGQTLVTASNDRTARLWNLNNQYTKILREHEGVVFDLVFSPNGELIATAGWDNTAILWNAEGTLLKVLKGHNGRVHRLNFSPDGRILATPSDDRTVKLWDVSGNPLSTLKGHQDIVWAVSFSPDGRTIATASEDRTAKLWDLNGNELKTLKGHRLVVNSVAFSPDGSLIATASWDKTVKLWNREGKELKTLQGHTDGINVLTFSPDGSLIATASWDKTVKLWNREGKELRTLKGHDSTVNDVAFSPDSQFIATASGDGTVKLWSREGIELQTLRRYQDAVWSVGFSPDGKILATSSEDKLILRHLFLQDLDQTLQHSCNWISNYLNNNPNADRANQRFCNQFTRSNKSLTSN